MEHTKSLALAAALSLATAASALSAETESGARVTLDNGLIAADLEGGRLVGLRGLTLVDPFGLAISGDEASLTWAGERLSTEGRRPVAVERGRDEVTFTYEAGPRSFAVRYELRPGWRFVAKRVILGLPKGAAGKVDAVEVMKADLGAVLKAPAGASAPEEHRIGGGSRGVLLRFASLPGSPGSGAFFVLQNPFMKWERAEGRISMAYAPEMEWREAYGPFESDRACIGVHRLTGNRLPARPLPEWKYFPEPEKALDGLPWIDVAELEALRACVAAFVIEPPRKSLKVHVPWCENDYQIDVATPEGREEWKRIIDRAAEVGCEDVLFTPANSAVSRLEDNADAWGWENILWLGLGQQIRMDRWDPAKDAVPPSVQEFLDYARSRNVRLVAYVYPTLGWKQDPEWTRWCEGKTGGYVGVDTGVRSFQDWFVDKLVAFARKTGASGYCFDHWWIAYDKATSKYAQWYGCRRILEELRRRIPGVVIDGRQQYQWFGAWTWTGGSYPHPTTNDEQPSSFENFPDLHFDRVSADRQRYAAWYYGVEQFAPVDLLPGYMTHQSQRNDGKGVMRRDRFHIRDWDLLGWKYSAIASIGTAPVNNVVDFLPARDLDEFRLFPKEDAAWIRGWMEWTDRNLGLLLRLRPIIGPPAIGRVDGTAAFDGDRGVVFLWNPNYRALPAEFSLDGSIGLAPKGREDFVLRELYPVEGRLLGKPGAGAWTAGDRVSLRIKGPQAMVLEVVPAAAVARPALLGAPGRAEVVDGTLRLSGVRGLVGTACDLAALLPPGADVRAATVNGAPAKFERRGDAAIVPVRFAGEPFEHCQQIGSYDRTFPGGKWRAEVTVPKRVFEGLTERRKAWPVPYDAEDLLATWLGSDRLLLFIQVADPQDTWTVGLTIDGKPVEVRKAYGAVYADARERTFLGFYADISSIEPGVAHKIEADLPVLEPGRFQGLFLENVEDEFTEAIAR